MVYLVFLIRTEKGLEKVCQSITNLRREDYVRSEFVVFSDLDVSEVENLVKKKEVPFTQYDTYSFGDWRRQRKDDDLVVYVNEYIILLGGEIEKLKSDYLIESSAGFIAGRFIEFPLWYKVDDIYKPLKKEFMKTGTGLSEIDIAYPYLFISKGDRFKILDFENRFEFGLGLRRLGYQNYLDNDIEVGYDE